MRYSSFLLAVPLAFVLGCDGTTSPPRSPDIPGILASSEAIPEGGAAFTPCGSESDPYPNVAFDSPGHWDSIRVTLSDSGHDPSICGDLVFDGRSRGVSAVFATNDGDGLVPWVHWWGGWRFRTTGA
jgi:hypothetical protein